MYVYGRKQLKDVKCLKQSLIRGLAGILTLVTAFGIRQMENSSNEFCSPHSLFQLHAAWHVLLSIGLWLLFTGIYCQEFKQKYHFMFQRQQQSNDTTSFQRIEVRMESL